MSFKRPQVFSRSDIPQPNRVVGAPTRERRTIGGKRYGRDAVRMFNDVQDFPGVGIP